MTDIPYLAAYVERPPLRDRTAPAAPAGAPSARGPGDWNGGAGSVAAASLPAGSSPALAIEPEGHWIQVRIADIAGRAPEGDEQPYAWPEPCHMIKRLPDGKPDR